MAIITCLMLLIPQDDPTGELEKARKLMEKAEELLEELKSHSSVKPQAEVVRILNELIRKAKMQTSDRSSLRSSPSESREGRSPAERTYAPSSTSPPRVGEKFIGRPGRGWGNLGPKERAMMIHGFKAADQYPPEMREDMKDYFEAIGGNPK